MIAALVLILQLLGLVGLLSALPVALAGLLAGAGLWRAGGGPRLQSSPPPAPPAAGRLAPLAALAAGCASCWPNGAPACFPPWTTA